MDLAAQTNPLVGSAMGRATTLISSSGVGLCRCISNLIVSINAAIRITIAQARWLSDICVRLAVDYDVKPRTPHMRRVQNPH